MNTLFQYRAYGLQLNVGYIPCNGNLFHPCDLKQNVDRFDKALFNDDWFCGVTSAFQDECVASEAGITLCPTSLGMVMTD